MRWLSSVTKRYKGAIRLDLRKRGLSYDDLGINLSVADYYYIVKHELMMEGSWLYARINKESRPSTYQEEVTLQAMGTIYRFLAEKAPESGLYSIEKNIEGNFELTAAEEEISKQMESGEFFKHMTYEKVEKTVTL